MSSGMNLEQAREYAKTMTYMQAVANITYAKGIKYRKATIIKLCELAKIADKLDTMYYPQVNGITLSVIDTDWNEPRCSTCGYSPQTPPCDSCEGYSNWYPLIDMKTCDDCKYDKKPSVECDKCDKRTHSRYERSE